MAKISPKSQYLRTYVDQCRQEIQPNILIRRLVGHVLGDIEMSPSQVSAGLGLLRKVIPDVSSMDIAMMQEAGPETLRKIERVIIDAVAQRTLKDNIDADEAALTPPDTQAWLN